MGSAGEVTLLTAEERKDIVRQVVEMTWGRIPVFFGATFPTTEDSVKFAQFAEAEGADGLIFIVSPYLLPPQSAILEHMRACMGSVRIPVGVYNNPNRLGVDLEVETLVTLAGEFPNFIVDKGGTADPRPAGRRDPPSLSRTRGREARQTEGNDGRHGRGSEVRPGVVLIREEPLTAVTPRKGLDVRVFRIQNARAGSWRSGYPLAPLGDLGG